MAIPGLSTLGIEVGYNVATATDTLPTAFTPLPRCNSIGGIALSPATIDASALEDYVTKRVAGRSDTPETVELTFNNTSEVRTALTTMISAYNTGVTTNANTVVCIEVYDPKDADGAVFFYVQPPAKLAMSEYAQNSLKTIPLTCTLVEYHGYGTGVKPAAG